MILGYLNGNSEAETSVNDNDTLFDTATFLRNTTKKLNIVDNTSLNRDDNAVFLILDTKKDSEYLPTITTGTTTMSIPELFDENKIKTPTGQRLLEALNINLELEDHAFRNFTREKVNFDYQNSLCINGQSVAALHPKVMRPNKANNKSPGGKRVDLNIFVWFVILKRLGKDANLLTDDESLKDSMGTLRF